MADVLSLQVPVKVGLELGTVVCLDDQDPEGKSADDLVHEANRCLLVADVVDLEYADASAVVDRCELIEALSRSGDAFQEFYVDLQAVAWLWFLVPMPGTACRPSLLVGR